MVTNFNKLKDQRIKKKFPNFSFPFEKMNLLKKLKKEVFIRTIPLFYSVVNPAQISIQLMK